MYRRRTIDICLDTLNAPFCHCAAVPFILAARHMWHAAEHTMDRVLDARDEAWDRSMRAYDFSVHEGLMAMESAWTRLHAAKRACLARWWKETRLAHKINKYGGFRCVAKHVWKDKVRHRISFLRSPSPGSLSGLGSDTDIWSEGSGWERTEGPITRYDLLKMALAEALALQRELAEERMETRRRRREMAGGV